MNTCGSPVIQTPWRVADGDVGHLHARRDELAERDVVERPGQRRDEHGRAAVVVAHRHVPAARRVRRDGRSERRRRRTARRRPRRRPRPAVIGGPSSARAAGGSVPTTSTGSRSRPSQRATAWRLSGIATTAAATTSTTAAATSSGRRHAPCARRADRSPPARRRRARPRRGTAAPRRAPPAAAPAPRSVTSPPPPTGREPVRGPAPCATSPCRPGRRARRPSPASDSPATKRHASTARSRSSSRPSSASRARASSSPATASPTGSPPPASRRRAEALLAAMSPRPRPHGVAGVVGDDPQQPRAHRRVAAPRPQRPVPLHERVLHDVPRLLRRSADARPPAAAPPPGAAARARRTPGVTRQGAPDEHVVVRGRDARSRSLGVAHVLGSLVPIRHRRTPRAFPSTSRADTDPVGSRARATRPRHVTSASRPLPPAPPTCVPATMHVVARRAERQSTSGRSGALTARAACLPTVPLRTSPVHWTNVVPRWKGRTCSNVSPTGPAGSSSSPKRKHACSTTATSAPSTSCSG